MRCNARDARSRPNMGVVTHVKEKAQAHFVVAICR